MASNGDGLPSLKKDLQNSLLFLQRCGESGDSLFDHLLRVISKVTDERPANVLDYFELFSERVRLEKFNESQPEEAYEEPARLALAKKLLPNLIEKSKQPVVIPVETEELEHEEVVDEEVGDAIYGETSSGDLWELQFYWNLLGIGLPREEIFPLACSIARLKANPTVGSCRFWGKMLGLKSDYYIVESTLTGSTLENRIVCCKPTTLHAQKSFPQMTDKESQSATRHSSDRARNSPTPSPAEKLNLIFSISSSPLQNSAGKPINSVSLEASEESAPLLDPTEPNANTKVENNDDKDNNSDLRAEVESYPAEWNFSMSVADSKYRPPVEIPAEEMGHGVNRHAYFVCCDLNDEWTELPPASPHQINVSRRMKRYLTGNLEEAITSFPAFPGTEKNYLRALIARISAGAHVSPRGFYQIGSNEMDEQESFDAADDDDDVDDVSLNNDKPITESESYRPWSLSKLMKLDYWEHHKPEILKQGRVSFLDGGVMNKNDDEGDTSSDGSDEEDETEAPNNGMIPEIPIPLFASCSGDLLTNDSMSPWTIRLSDVVETLVLVQSHVWPGAFAFAKASPAKDRACDNIYIGFGHKYSSGPSANYGSLASPQQLAEHPETIEADDPTVVEEEEAIAKRQNDITDDVNGDDEDKVAGSQ